MARLCRVSVNPGSVVALILFGLLGVSTGLIDALSRRWDVKAFLWSGVIVLYLLILTIVLYSSRMEGRAKRGALVAIIGLCGFIGAHHFTWLVAFIMEVDYKPGDKLWLAPGIYAGFWEYTILTGVGLLAYIVFLAYAWSCLAEPLSIRAIGREARKLVVRDES